MNKRRQVIVSVIVSVCVLVSIFGIGCMRKPEVYLETYSSENESGHQVLHDADSMSERATEAETSSEVEAVSFYVYVCGAVAKPGVYVLPEGSRIYEALEMAGGLLENADVNLLNQAGLLLDGQMIRVYTYEEGQQNGLEGRNVANPSQEQNAIIQDDRVNINTAAKSELMTLPGIGSAKADAIIAYREAHGLFSNIEELMNSPGIKEGIFLQIKELIRVN